MVADPGQPLDHGPDAGKGPVVAVEAVRAGTLPQRLVDSGKLLVGQARRVPGRAGAAQRRQPTDTPQRVPAADVLAGHPEGAGDLGLGVAGGKQRAGLHADVLERLAVAQTPGVAAVGGWSHTAILPPQPRSCHRKGRTSLSSRRATHGHQSVNSDNNRGTTIKAKIPHSRFTLAYSRVLAARGELGGV